MDEATTPDVGPPVEVPALVDVNVVHACFAGVLHVAPGRAGERAGDRGGPQCVMVTGLRAGASSRQSWVFGQEGPAGLPTLEGDPGVQERMSGGVEVRTSGCGCGDRWCDGERGAGQFDAGS